MATVSGLIDAALSENADMVVTFSTPSLQAALQRVRTTPVIYTHVADALAAGAGPTRQRHQNNVTGVDMVGPFPEMIALIKQHLPKVKKIGTLFVPAEVNMVASKEQLEAAARVMRGESPGAIPLESVKTVRLVVNLNGARATGFAVPPAIIKSAAEVIGR
jgi:ABC-type uncharacterized transport system substrate-binding protein